MIMIICYFCGVESDELKKCPQCLQQYCPIHIVTQNHDCPLIPIQNPYDIILDETTNHQEQLNNKYLNQNQSSQEHLTQEQLTQEQLIQEQFEPNITVSSNINEYKSNEVNADELSDLDAINMELNEKDDAETKLKKSEEVEAKFKALDKAEAKSKGSNYGGYKFDNDNDSFDEFEVELAGVFDLEHNHDDPDAYLQPDQLIKGNAPLIKHVKVMKNRVKKCYYCNKLVQDVVTHQFIEIRNVSEGLFKSTRRGKCGGEVDGF